MERNYTINTQKSYCDAFSLFLDFMETERKIKPYKIKFSDIDDTVILSYLDWLETVHKSSVRTKNQRLAIIKSFYKYVIRKEPELINTCIKIREINKKKESKRKIDYFTEEEIKCIIKYVNIHYPRKYLIIISILYETAMRVSEVINIKTIDISFGESPSVVVRYGKGRKSRVIPISNELSRILDKYISNEYINYGEHYLLYTKFDNAYTRYGIYDFVNRLIPKMKLQYPTLFNKSYHPHSFRHSKATHLYNKGVLLLVIKEFLGHSSVLATEIYATPDGNRIRSQLVEGNKDLDSLGRYDEKKKSDIREWLNKKR